MTHATIYGDELPRDKVLKIVKRTLIAILVILFLLIVGTFGYHLIKSNNELSALKDNGYYNKVSVGNYSLNIAKFGNKNGKHTIVGLAGLGAGDYSVTARQMTQKLEKENLVVFIDRAGYGLSDDFNGEMTLERIVEDYRKALKNAGIDGPYVLMPHSIGGVYATYWCSQYPDEVEAIAFIDCSILSSDAFNDEIDKYTSDNSDVLLTYLSKAGFGRYIFRDYYYLYSDNYSDKEQELGDALSIMTMDSVAVLSESNLVAKNAQNAFNSIIKNDVPKLYICSSWGFKSIEEYQEYIDWLNKRSEKNGTPHIININNQIQSIQNMITALESEVETRLVPYMEKMGNCEIAYLAGAHMIYEQKPDECGKIIEDFINTLNK